MISKKKKVIKLNRINIILYFTKLMELNRFFLYYVTEIV